MISFSARSQFRGAPYPQKESTTRYGDRYQFKMMHTCRPNVEHTGGTVNRPILKQYVDTAKQCNTLPSSRTFCATRFVICSCIPLVPLAFPFVVGVANPEELTEPERTSFIIGNLTAGFLESDFSARSAAVALGRAGPGLSLAFPRLG